MRAAITPVTTPLHAVTPVPGSKSITNRALLMAALGNARLTLRGALHSEDTEVMQDALNRLAIPTERTGDGDIRVHGSEGHIPVSQAELYVANAGTAARFLTAAVCLGQGEYALDGVARMRQRPMDELLGALRAQGAVITESEQAGYMPYTVSASGLSGGEVVMRGSTSSQFISAVMIAAPYDKSDTVIKLQGEIVSKPFLDMTLRMMHQFGVNLEWQNDTISIPCGQCYSRSQSAPFHQDIYTIEPDATAASYFWAAAALVGGQSTVPDIPEHALQGDVRFVECLKQMGCEVITDSSGLTVKSVGELKGISVNMGDISDTFLTLAAIAPFASSPVEIRGVEHSRKQECDRVSAVCTELAKLGATVEEYADGLKVWPSKLHGGNVNTYKDHRMAMAFSLIALKVPGIVIDGAECVNKTFPDYWQRLAKIANVEVEQ